MNEEKLKIAVFIDFDNIQIGVRSTLGRDFDLALVLEALKERGEVVTKIAYGNWKRAGELTRTLTQNAVLMVQRDLTPRGDKNGADINLALDALEMAINQPHINAFVIVGGDSDFISLVEKLKQYNKAVFVVGGRSFTSSVMQRNCREFLGYENLIEATGPSDRRRDEGSRRREVYSLQRAVPLVYRGLKVLADREVQPQLGLLKSTLVQLDSTFNERDYGFSSFRNFMQRMADAQLLSIRQQGNSYVVEPLDREPAVAATEAPPSNDTPVERPERQERTDGAESAGDASAGFGDGNEDSSPATYSAAPAPPFAPASFAPPPPPSRPPEEALELLDRVLEPLRGTNPRPLYLRNVKQLLRNEASGFDEQQHGFASLVDLLRAGQDRNWLRLQRDRRGALRVFIPPSANGTVTASTPSIGNGADASPAPGPGNESGNEDITPQGAIVRSTDEDRQPFFADSAPTPPAPRREIEPEDSQIALLGYYRGVHGEGSEEAPLSLADAVADGGRKKRGPRKPRGEGGSAPRRRKPKR